jgi:hypothetical protein
MMATFVLIPGAGGSAWYWHRVVPLLRAGGHRAIPVDLPGDDDTAGLDRYADAVVDTVSAAGTDGASGDPVGAPGPLVLVASSLAGFTAPLVCDRLSVELIVLVNAMIPTPGETAGDWWAATGQGPAQRSAAERAGRLAPGDPDEDEAALFLHDVPADVVADGAAHLRQQSGRPFQDRWPLGRWPDVPTRCLASTGDRLFPIEFQRRVAVERLGIVPDELPGGHLIALSRPTELTERLIGYLPTPVAAARASQPPASPQH